MSQTGHPLSGVRVLVVDDEPLVREAAEAILTLRGARTSSAASQAGGLALAVSRQGPPDVVLVDLGLPDVRAGDLLAPWRRACPDAGIVVITGADAREAEDLLSGAGACLLLLKPFGADELVDAVTRALPHPRHSS